MKVGFEAALGKLLEHEGGYSNHPSDTGGETYNGISRRWFPKWDGWNTIDSYEDKSELKYSDDLRISVAGFYYSYFWYKIKADRIENQFIAEMLFITAVNVGKKVAIKKLQRILKVKQDGLIGNITIGALNEAEDNEFIYHYILELVDFYLQASKQGENIVFLRGWLNRGMSFYYNYEMIK